MAGVPPMTEWEPVAVPLAEGLDVNTRARLVAPTKLLRAENVYFPRGGGPEKRKGYTASIVENGSYTGETEEDFLYGYGMIDISTQIESNEVSPFAGPLKGILTRNQEVAVWDGFRLYSENATGYREPITA